MADTGRPKLTIRLDELELRQLQALAHNQGIPAAELARKLILNYITTHAKPDVSLLERLKQRSEFLDPAPDDLGHIPWRTAERRPCTFCDARAITAVIAQTPFGPRWVDLCFPHRQRLLRETTPPDLTSDWRIEGWFDKP